MSKVIHKFTFDGVLGEEIFPMPKGSKILSAQMQGVTLCVWALVDTTSPKVRRRLRVCGTGHAAPEGEFIDTVQMGPYVWHIFDGGEI